MWSLGLGSRLGGGGPDSLLISGSCLPCVGVGALVAVLSVLAGVGGGRAVGVLMVALGFRGGSAGEGGVRRWVWAVGFWGMTVLDLNSAGGLGPGERVCGLGGEWSSVHGGVTLFWVLERWAVWVLGLALRVCRVVRRGALGWGSWSESGVAVESAVADVCLVSGHLDGSFAWRSVGCLLCLWVAVEGGRSGGSACGGEGVCVCVSWLGGGVLVHWCECGGCSAGGVSVLVRAVV